MFYDRRKGHPRPEKYIENRRFFAAGAGVSTRAPGTVAPRRILTVVKGVCA